MKNSIAYCFETKLEFERQILVCTCFGAVTEINEKGSVRERENEKEKEERTRDRERQRE